MDYMTISDAAAKWGISSRRVQILCASGRISGAERLGRSWAIPKDAEKPGDARIKSGRYIGFSQKYRSKSGYVVLQCMDSAYCYYYRTGMEMDRI